MRAFLLRLTLLELGDLGFEAGESRLNGGAPIVFRRGVGGCVRGTGDGGAVCGGG